VGEKLEGTQQVAHQIVQPSPSTPITTTSLRASSSSSVNVRRWHRVTGRLEILCAILIALPLGRSAGLGIGAIIIVAASLTVLRHRSTIVKTQISRQILADIAALVSWLAQAYPEVSHSVGKQHFVLNRRGTHHRLRGFLGLIASSPDLHELGQKIEPEWRTE